MKPKLVSCHICGKEIPDSQKRETIIKKTCDGEDKLFSYILCYECKQKLDNMLIHWKHEKFRESGSLWYGNRLVCKQ